MSALSLRNAAVRRLDKLAARPVQPATKQGVLVVPKVLPPAEWQRIALVSQAALIADTQDTSHEQRRVGR